MKNDLQRAYALIDPPLDMLPHIERLDLLLQRALQQQGQDPEDRLDLRSLFLSPDEMAARLKAPRGVPAWMGQHYDAECGEMAAVPTTGRLADVVARYGLCPIERDLLLLSLMPQLDERYGALFAFWQADDARRWPTLANGLRLLCPQPRTRVFEQARLSAQSPLFALVLVKQPRPGQVPADLRIVPSVYHYLLGDDSRVAVHAVQWVQSVADAFYARWLAALAADWRTPSGMSPIVLLRGGVDGAVTGNELFSNTFIVAILTHSMQSTSFAVEFYFLFTIPFRFFTIQRDKAIWFS